MNTYEEQVKIWEKNSREAYQRMVEREEQE